MIPGQFLDSAGTAAPCAPASDPPAVPATHTSSVLPCVVLRAVPPVRAAGTPCRPDFSGHDQAAVGYTPGTYAARGSGSPTYIGPAVVNERRCSLVALSLNLSRIHFRPSHQLHALIFVRIYSRFNSPFYGFTDCGISHELTQRLTQRRELTRGPPRVGLDESSRIEPSSALTPCPAPPAPHRTF